MELVRVTERAAVAAARLARPRRREARPTRPPSTPCVKRTQQAADRRHHRDRRGRARRGAHALSSARPSAPATGPKVDIAARSARGHHALRQGPCLNAHRRHGHRPGRQRCCYAPDVYMHKIAIGPGYAGRHRSISTAAPADNVTALAQGQGREAGQRDSPCCILDRPRHADLIAAGAARPAPPIRLITDGDVAGVIHVATMPDEDRHRPLPRQRRRAGRRPGGGGAALHRRPDAGPPDSGQPGEDAHRARAATMGIRRLPTGSTAITETRRTATCSCRRHRRHRRQRSWPASASAATSSRPRPSCIARSPALSARSRPSTVNSRSSASTERRSAFVGSPSLRRS
jgi:hypothetical protein